MEALGGGAVSDERGTPAPSVFDTPGFSNLTVDDGGFVDPKLRGVA